MIRMLKSQKGVGYFMKRWLSVLLLCSLIGGLLSGCEWSGSGSPMSHVYISEILPNNNGNLADESGAHPGWIELYNPTALSVSLEGYSLRSGRAQEGFVFGNITLEPGEYQIVFASGKNSQDLENRVLHTNFTLDPTTDVLYFTDATGKELTRITYKAMSENVSCGIDELGQTVCYLSPTPGTTNSQIIPQEEVLAPNDSHIPLSINEYATSSSVTLADEDGDFVSWIELHNYGSESINLKDYTLSDDTTKPDKWRFPSVQIDTGGYLVVYLSDKTKPYEEGSPLHADFVLSGKEETITLYEVNGNPIDSAPVYDLTSNLTYGHPKEDRASRLFFPRATPGAANTVTGFASIDSARYPENKTLVISEVSPVNTHAIKAADGFYYDFIELYNPKKEPISLKGYRLSDKGNLREYYELPDVTINADSYYTIWCGTDENDFGTQSKQTYLKMGLNRYGEELYLTDAKGVVLDTISTGRISGSASCGLVSMKDSATYRFDTLTPGAPNPSVGLGGPAPSPVFSLPSGYTESGTAVSISCPGADIYYTLDGSTPTKQSTRYTAPIAVNQTMTVRAIAYMEGRLPSDTRAGSYIVGRRHTLPVMFLSTDPANFFDYNTGIWANGPGYTAAFPHVGANFWKDWERPVHVEYMDANGQAQLEFDAGVKIFGQYSRANKQKSLSINMRDKYGVTEVCYPFFGEGTATNVYSELVLRASGQDYNMAHIRDAFCSSVVAGQMDLDLMDYQPVVVYLNGEYWGLYDLREKICESYVTNRYGCDEDEVDMIKGNDDVMAGSYDDYEALLEYVKSHDLSKAEHYQYVTNRVDVQELCNYWIAESFFVNTDTGNIKFYQTTDGQSKWRWVMFDYDWALFPSTHWQNYLEEIVNPKGHGVGRAFSTTLMRGLMENAEFRELFLSSYVHHLETTFETKRMLTIFDEMITEIEEEMPYQIERWESHASVERWKSYVSTLRDIVEKQNGLVKEMLIKTVSGTTSNRTLSAIWRNYYHLTREEVEARFTQNTSS